MAAVRSVSPGSTRAAEWYPRYPPTHTIVHEEGPSARTIGHPDLHCERRHGSLADTFEPCLGCHQFHHGQAGISDRHFQRSRDV